MLKEGCDAEMRIYFGGREYNEERHRERKTCDHKKWYFCNKYLGQK